MKHLKMLGLAAMATAALMAFAGSASANPTLTSPAGVDYTGELDLSATGSLMMKISVFEITCTEATVKGKVETNNTEHAAGKITALSFSNCGGATVDILALGSLTIKGDTDTGLGTVSGSGTQVTWQFVGITCTYGTTNNTPLGTFKGGNPAVITINASLPKIGGGFLCANPASLQGQYTFTSPKPLLID